MVALWRADHENHDRQGDDRDRDQPASRRGSSASTRRRSSACPLAVSAAIGAIGGILVDADHADQLRRRHAAGARRAFAAAMLGGMGHPVGAVVGGLIVGLLETFGAGYVSSAYKDAIAFLVILAVLFVMPQGLFGRAGIERV